MHRVTFHKSNVMSECERKHKNTRISKNEMTNKKKRGREAGRKRKVKKKEEKEKGGTAGRAPLRNRNNLMY